MILNFYSVLAFSHQLDRVQSQISVLQIRFTVEIAEGGLKITKFHYSFSVAYLVTASVSNVWGQWYGACAVCNGTD